MELGKRGQGLSVTTLILIVIGVLILVILILGFTIGWAKIFPFISPPNNVADVANKCRLACSTEAKFDYCSQTRDLSIEEGVTLGGKKETKIEATCNDLSAIEALGIEGCSSLGCGAYSEERFAKAECESIKGDIDEGSDRKIEYTGGDEPFSCEGTKKVEAAPVE